MAVSAPPDISATASNWTCCPQSRRLYIIFTHRRLQVLGEARGPHVHPQEAVDLLPCDMLSRPLPPVLLTQHLDRTNLL